MKKLQNFQALMFRPRYLRAIPSLVVLTTAMAWSVMPDADALDSAAGEKSHVSQAHGVVRATGVGNPLVASLLPGKGRADQF